MRKLTIGLLATLTLLMLGFTTTAEETATLTGEYQWDQGGSSGELRAEFTSTGENTWDVSFHFDFRGKGHIYEGTAEGSLTDGSLEGEVKNENRRRTFTFTGTTAGGQFEGTHAELEDGKPFDTGTLTLGH